MALRAATLAAALLAVGSLPPATPPAAAQRVAQRADGPPPAAAPSFKPAAPPAAPDAWIFSGVLDDGREPYSGTLLAGSDATEFEFKLGAGVSCAGGDTAIGPGTVRLSDVPCSDGRTMGIAFVSRGDAELTVFGQVGAPDQVGPSGRPGTSGRAGARRFTASAHRLGTDAPVAVDPAPRVAPPTLPPILPPTASPPAAPTPSDPAPPRRLRNG